MNSFNSEYIIYIREQDGTRTMFSAGELRDRLEHCIGDSGISDDITLAVEYALLNRRELKSDLVFDRGEIDAAVVRLLEETGFPEAAEEYRNGVDFEEELLTAEPAGMVQFLRRHLGCGEERLEKVASEVVASARKIGVEKASPHLFLELARHFAKHAVNTTVSELPELHKLDIEQLEKLPEQLSEKSRVLWKKQVVDIECITAIFPCVKFHIYMEKFTNHYDVSCPATELLVYPQAMETGAVLGECRSKLLAGAAGNKLPCTLVVHDLRQFVREAFDCSDETKCEQAAQELGDIFASELSENLFKLDFD